MWNWNIKKILIGLSIICLSAGITGFLSSCSRGESAEETLVVACGDDLAGIVVQSVVEQNNITIEKLGMDYMSVGDCCGSNAQFALSAEEVDIAVLCPDAVKNLQDAGKDYEVLGTVVYDGNVFVKRADSPENPEVIGYMNKRTEQLELLQEIYGTDKNYRPVFASALSYALENKDIDMAVMDITTALKLNYPMEPATSGVPTSIMVVKRERNEVENQVLQQFIEDYNEKIEGLENDKNAGELLSRYLEIEPSEEVLSNWNHMNVQFGFLTMETEENES